MLHNKRKDKNYQITFLNNGSVVLHLGDNFSHAYDDMKHAVNDLIAFLKDPECLKFWDGNENLTPDDDGIGVRIYYDVDDIEKNSGWVNIQDFCYFLKKLKIESQIILDDFPQTLYITPDEAGETYIHPKDEMIETLNYLRTVCYYDFCLEECAEIDLISIDKDFAIYQTAKTNKPHQVKIVKKDDEFKAQWL